MVEAHKIRNPPYGGRINGYPHLLGVKGYIVRSSLLG